MNETSTYIDIEEVMRYASLKALADTERQHGKVALSAIVVERIAHGYDIKPEDIEVAVVDIMVMPDGVSWGIDLVWWVPCDECGDEVHQDEIMGSYPTLCETHFREARAQEHADLENDDIKSGVREW